MPGKLVAIGGDRMEDLHSKLDEAITEGAEGAVLIVMYPDGHEEGWTAYATSGTTPADRCFLYQSLIMLEVVDCAGAPDDDG